MIYYRLFFYLSLISIIGLVFPINVVAAGYYFPPPGQTLSQQSQQTPQAVGLNPNVVTALSGKASRWALWRHGYLVHVEGNFNQTAEVKSLRKTWHALTVGAAVKQGKIPDFKTQKISVYQTNLVGKDADATWRHVITQSAGFDYPGCGDNTDYAPGQMWTYSDLNLKNLTEGLYKAWGSHGGSYTADNYKTVLNQAYFNAIGMQGWNTQLNADGIRLVLDLEDMGRLGLLALTGGTWNGVELIPSWFVNEFSTKQTAGMQVNYNGCNYGTYPADIGLTKSAFPEAPYGYLTWVNANSKFYSGADSSWVWGIGSGGFMILWNKNNGIVYAGVGVNESVTSNGVPQIIENDITGPNPLYEGEGTPTPPTSTPTKTPTPTQTMIPGDANGDGNVNIADYAIWLTNYNKNLSGPTNGDFNSNGKVDGVDFVIWLPTFQIESQPFGYLA